MASSYKSILIDDEFLNKYNNEMVEIADCPYGRLKINGKYYTSVNTYLILHTLSILNYDLNLTDEEIKIVHNLVQKEKYKRELIYNIQHYQTILNKIENQTWEEIQRDKYRY